MDILLLLLQVHFTTRQSFQIHNLIYILLRGQKCADSVVALLPLRFLPPAYCAVHCGSMAKKTKYSTFMVNSPILFPYSITSRPRRKAFSLFIAVQIYVALRASSLSAVLCLIRVLVQCFDVEADRPEAVVTAYHC